MSISELFIYQTMPNFKVLGLCEMSDMLLINVISIFSTFISMFIGHKITRVVKLINDCDEKV